MNEQNALRHSDSIFKDVFGKPNPFTLDQLKQKLGQGIPMPEVVHCVRSGAEVFTYDPQPADMPLSEEEFMKQAKVDDWMLPKAPLGSVEDVLAAWKKVRFMKGNKAVSSQEVEKSDSILNSQGVYMSTLIGSSKNILLSHNNFFSNYLLACRGNSSCNFCIRTFDSIYCSSSYEVRFSNKISKSFFINDCLDLYECMFCFGLRSKKYCIGNMQFEKDEYMKVKAMVIDWMLAELNGR